MKHFILGRLFLLPCICVILQGCNSAPPSPVPDTNQGTIMHEASGISFPFQHGSFKRTAVDYDVDNALITTDYFYTRADEVVTLRARVYPKPEMNLQEKLEILKEMLLAVEDDPENRFIATYDIPNNAQGDALYNGKRAFFRLRDDAFANIYIFEYGDWFVEYHTKFPRNLEWEAEGFVNTFSWLAEPDTKSE